MYWADLKEMSQYIFVGIQQPVFGNSVGQQSSTSSFGGKDESTFYNCKN